MPTQARDAHANLIARDWCKLADLYQQVFGYAAALEGNLLELQKWER